MRVISNRRLVDFGQLHPDAAEPLRSWRKLVESRSYQGFSDLKQTFGSADIVGDKHVFDIRGNRYRLVCRIDYQAQHCYIRAILTHVQYDRGHWK
ncbi:type II toxin-antitoxin system HigB family toxin [Luteibacter sp. dw_328]|uniref:type II toxin-antitoxin system HigB family toxin n=1 Tax=Luteibacter sp. dw_328 TaxID=2719796 RepID=UPI001BD4BBDF|nr:type II toxin-antitoxin system HigB family toxin [Luteibacter sp. dw_328]